MQHSLVLLSWCAGRSLWALRCRQETSTCTKGCAVTAFPSSPSAEDVWCVRTTCSCVPKDPGSSTHSAFFPITFIRRWSSERRWVLCLWEERQALLGQLAVNCGGFKIYIHCLYKRIADSVCSVAEVCRTLCSGSASVYRQLILSLSFYSVFSLLWSLFLFVCFQFL